MCLSVRDDLQTVKFSGGHLDGAVLALPPEVAARVDRADLTVTPAGKVYDMLARSIVRGAEVIELPNAQRMAAPSRRRISRPR